MAIIQPVQQQQQQLRSLGATPGSWAAGAHSGARRVRWGANSLHGSMALKPRLLDPEEDEQHDT